MQPIRAIETVDRSILCETRKAWTNSETVKEVVMLRTVHRREILLGIMLLAAVGLVARVEAAAPTFVMFYGNIPRNPSLLLQGMKNCLIGKDWYP